MRGWRVAVIGLLAMVAGAVGAGWALGRSTPVRAASSACPKDVRGGSINAPASTVLKAAQRLLAKEAVNAQGKTYRLTQRNAPIMFLEQLGQGAGPTAVPGQAVLYRAAVRACGKRTAEASWAIEYPITVSVISTAAGYRFVVDTKRGWVLWGHWCGVGQPESVRKAVNC